MRYVRTKDKIVTSDELTHELTEDIVDAGYYRELKAGSLVKVGKTWYNFYGKWTTLIDEEGMHYDIRPELVEKVTRALPSSDKLEELFDVCIGIGKHRDAGLNVIAFEIRERDNGEKYVYIDDERWYIPLQKFLEDFDCHGAILTAKGLIFVAKLDGEGWKLA